MIQPFRPGRYQPRSVKQKHFWCSCISPALCSCISEAIKSEAKEHLDDTAVSKGAVYQSRELYINSDQNGKRKHFWSTQLCLPGRCINRDQQSKSISGAAVYNEGGIVVYKQPSKLKRRHVCTEQARRPGRYITRESCISTAIKTESERISGRQSRVDLGGVSTAISKAKAFLAQLYTTIVV